VSWTVDDNQAWWWRIVLPFGVLLLIACWWTAVIGAAQEKTGRDLYGLFGRTDSAGNEQIYWERNGREEEFDAVELPYYSGLVLLLGTAAVGGIGVRRAAGWFTVIGIWVLNLFCALLLTFAFCWLWINVVGIFI